MSGKDKSPKDEAGKVASDAEAEAVVVGSKDPRVLDAFAVRFNPMDSEVMLESASKSVQSAQSESTAVSEELTSDRRRPVLTSPLCCLTDTAGL